MNILEYCEPTTNVILIARARLLSVAGFNEKIVASASVLKKGTNSIASLASDHSTLSSKVEIRSRIILFGISILPNS